MQPLLGSRLSERSAGVGADETIFGRYRPLAKLGQGGMADVFLAIALGTRGLNKLAVIKRLRADLTGNDTQDYDEDDAQFTSMFFDEAKLAARLNHPNIVHTYEVGEEDGALYIVMEYVEGQSLHALQKRLSKLEQRISPPLAARLVSEVLAGLHYAHELTDYEATPLNIVHRDVSPQNVMISYQGGVKLFDFGIAKAASSTVKTEVGMLKGKVRYMSPEQAAGASVDRRADIFTAGILLWELLTLERLIRGETHIANLLALLNEPFPKLRSALPDVDARLEQIVEKALQKDPDARYQTALAMREDLEEYIAATGSNVTTEHVARFVCELFDDVRKQTAQHVRGFMAAAETKGAETRTPPRNTEFETLLAAEQTGSTERRALPTIGSPAATFGSLDSVAGSINASIQADPLDFAPPRRKAKVAVLVGAIAVMGAGAFAFSHMGNRASGGTPGDSIARPSPVAQNEIPLPPVAPTAMEPAAIVSPPPAAAPPAHSEPPSRNQTARGGGSKQAVAAATPKAGGPSAVAPPPSEEQANGYLTLDTYPWTRVSEGGRVLGTTPLVRIALSPGPHTLTLENPADGIKKVTTVIVKSGDTVSRRLAFE